MANREHSITQDPGGGIRMAQHGSIGTHASALIWRIALAAALTLLLLAAGQRPTAALHAAAAGAGTSATASHLYWANDGGLTIGRSNLDGTQVNNKFVVGGVGDQRLCGPTIAGKYLYWGIDVPKGGPAVGRARLDGSSVNRNFIPGYGDGPTCGVAVAGGYIFWASYANGDIGRARIDGTGVDGQFIGGLTSLFSGGYGCSVCDPNYVAIAGGYIYWAGAHAIGRARLDGTGVNDNFITGIYYPTGVAVTSTYIYWTDIGGNFIGGPIHPSLIGRARLDGTAVQRSFIKGLDGACGLAVTGKYIYWGQAGATGNGTTIGRANLDGTGVLPRFIAGLQSPCGVVVGP